MTLDIRYWLYLLAFIDLFGASCVVPVFGAHLRSLGFSHSLVGLMSSIYAAIQLFSGPIIGSWSDMYGRKTVLYITLFVCSLAYVFLSAASTFALVLSLRIILGLMKHTQTICKALVADVIPIDKQPDIQGKLSAFAALGFMFGPVLGGHIVAEFSDGFRYICYMTGSLFFLNSLVVFLSFPDIKLSENVRVKSNSNSTSMKSNIYRIFADLLNVDWKSYWDVFLLKFILGVSLSLFFSNYYVYVEETFQISPKLIGYTISFQGLVSAASGLMIDAFDRLYSEKSSNFLKIYHSFIILSLSFLAVYLSSNLYIFVLCLLPLSSSSTLIRTLSTELLLARSNANHRGSLMGASNSISSSARMVAPLLTGLIQDLFSSSSILIFAFFLSFSGTVVATVLNSNTVKKEKTV